MPCITVATAMKINTVLFGSETSEMTVNQDSVPFRSIPFPLLSLLSRLQLPDTDGNQIVYEYLEYLELIYTCLCRITDSGIKSSVHQSTHNKKEIVLFFSINVEQVISKIYEL